MSDATHTADAGSDLTEIALTLDAEAAAGLPYLDQYFGVWAMEERAFRQTAESVRQLDLSRHMQTRAEDARAAARNGRSFRTAGNVAIVPLQGTLMKQVGSLSAGTSTVQARRQIREAAADATIDGILLHIDSPGGTVAGTDDLAADVRNAARRKPVDAFIEDLGASAAYLVASQASRVTVNPSGLVGSIGTLMVVEDLSGLAEQLGVKVHVIRFGEFKGAGTPGTAVTDAQLEEFQRIVDGFGEQFVRAVARGRNMRVGDVRGLADGRVHFAREARDLGLVDAVESFDQALRNLRNRSGTGESRSSSSNAATENGKSDMPENNDQSADATTQPAAPRAATYQELAAICGAEETAFICEQLAAGATAAQAQQAWNETLAERVRIRDEQLADLQKNQAGRAAGTDGRKSPAIDGLGSNHEAAESDTSDPIAAFDQAVRERMQAGLSKPKAIREVAVKQPELHAAYLDAYNAAHGRSRG